MKKKMGEILQAWMCKPVEERCLWLFQDCKKFRLGILSRNIPQPNSTHCALFAIMQLFIFFMQKFLRTLRTSQRQIHACHFTSSPADPAGQSSVTNTDLQRRGQSNDFRRTMGRRFLSMKIGLLVWLCIVWNDLACCGAKHEYWESAWRPSRFPPESKANNAQQTSLLVRGWPHLRLLDSKYTSLYGTVFCQVETLDQWKNAALHVPSPGCGMLCFSEHNLAWSFCVPLHEFACLLQPDEALRSLPRELGQELL